MMIIEGWISERQKAEIHSVQTFTHYEEPALMCACQEKAELLTAHTSRNPGRRFYKCKKNVCHIWIWEDLILDYIRKIRENEDPEEEISAEELLQEESKPEEPDQAEAEEILDLQDVSNDD